MIWKLFIHFTQISSVFANIFPVSIWLIRINPTATGLDLSWTVYEESGFFSPFCQHYFDSLFAELNQYRNKTRSLKTRSFTFFFSFQEDMVFLRFDKVSSDSSL